MSHNRAITYQEIRESQLADFLRIYNESFPIDERRLYADEGELRRFMSAKRGKFHILALNEENRLLGFISYWQFERYCYIEHFAIDASERGRRLGSEMLGYVRDNIDSRILIEVEKPESEEARRRIGFYERNGYKLRSDIRYIQPPYSPEQEGLELLLMTHGEVDIESESDLIELKREVYNA